tara:strand:+ start:364 stop:543 length:180 start_codon:yes stop_codon:yes gene_type:complete
MNLTAKEKRAFILQSREKMPTTNKVDKYSKKIEQRIISLPEKIGEQRILNLLANFKKKK